MAEKLDIGMFKEKIFDWDKNKEWKFEGERPAIIDFYAEWCGPCKMLGPALEELAGKYSGKLDVYKVDIDEQGELAAAFGITSVPTLLFAPAEGEPRLAVGALPKAQLEKAVKEVLRVE